MEDVKVARTEKYFYGECSPQEEGFEKS